MVHLRLFGVATLAGALVLSACGGGGGGSTPARALQSGEIETWAGTGTAGYNGDGKALTASRMYWPIDVSFTQAGRAYVMDWNNHVIREVTAQGTFRTVVGDGFVGDGAPAGPNDLMAAGGTFIAPGTYSTLGTDVELNHPTQILELASGDMLFAAWHNHKYRRYQPSTGYVLAVAGNAPGYAGDGSVVDNTTRFNQPSGLALASDGSIYILDQRSQRIRKIDGTTGVISTVAGNPVTPAGSLPTPDFAGDGGPPLQAKFAFPTGSNPPPGPSIALDAQGRLYVADRLNHRIRRIDLTADTIETVAGGKGGTVTTGLDTGGYSGDGGPATDAELNMPRDVEIGPDGNLYIADSGNHRVRMVDLSTMVITTVAGNGTAVHAGDGGAATSASLNYPMGIAFDGAGDLYICDSYNNRIRRVKR